MNARLILMLAFLLVGIVGVSGALTDNITFSYTFDNSDTSGTTAIDASGSINATLVNSVTTGATGKIGQAYTFGSTKYVVANRNPYSANIYELTIAVWVKPSSLPASLMDVISTEDLSPGNGFTLRWNTNKLNFFRHTGGSATTTTESSINPLTAGTWSFIVVTFDNGNATIYVDDVQVGSSTSGTYIEYGTANPPVIGNNADISSGAFPRAWLGEIDDVTVWNTALSRSELTELYNSGDGLQYPFSPPPPANTTYVNLTAVDAYDDTAITTFNATIFGTTYSTTNGTINIDDTAFDESLSWVWSSQNLSIGGGSWTNNANVYDESFSTSSTPSTAVAVAEFTYSKLFDKITIKDGTGTQNITIPTPSACNVSSTGGGTAPRISVRAYKSTGSNQIQYFCGSTLDTLLHTSSSTDVFYNVEPWVENDIVDITFAAPNYFSNTSADVDVSSGSYQGSLAQAYVYFTCSERYTNASLSCDESGPFPRKAGLYNDDVNVSGYFSVASSYNITALTGTGEYLRYQYMPVSFSYSGAWDNPEYANDGNIETHPTGSAVGNYRLYWNFTTTVDDLVVVADNGAFTDYAIQPSCMPNPQIRYELDRPDKFTRTVTLSCWDGATWDSIGTWGTICVDPPCREYPSLLGIGSLETNYTVNTFNVSGFFDYNLTVSADDYAGNAEANFSINLYNENLSLNQGDNATGSSITYSLLSAYTYAVVLNATSTIYGDPVNQIGYANISIVGTPPASESYQFNLSAARPVFVTLYYEENLTLFENPANLTLTPLSDSSEVFISTSTSNGTANFYNIPVAEYRLRVSSPGYHDEDRYFILSTYTGQNLTAYFRENTTGTAKEFNVVDERNILQNGWIIRFQRYYNDTGWITVDEARSNIDGLAVENVLSDEYYRLILLNEGLVEEYRSDRTLLLQDTYQISSDVDTITNTQINKVLGVSGLVYMYPNLDRVEAIGTSSSGTRDWKLELYRTYTDGPVLINSTTASGDSVNLSLYLPNSTGRYYAVLSIMGSEIQTAANSIFIGGGPVAIGSSGAFYSFVLLLGIVGLAVFSAPAAIVLSIFALAIASMTGLFYVGLNAIVGLAIVGGMIIFRRNT